MPTPAARPTPSWRRRPARGRWRSGRRRLFIALEGGTRRPFDGEELVAAVAKLPADQRLSQRADEAILRRWVEAELEIVASGAQD